jgi:hypothetical protein
MFKPLHVCVRARRWVVWPVRGERLPDLADGMAHCHGRTVQQQRGKRGSLTDPKLAASQVISQAGHHLIAVKLTPLSRASCDVWPERRIGFVPLAPQYRQGGAKHDRGVRRHAAPVQPVPYERYVDKPDAFSTRKA